MCVNSLTSHNSSVRKVQSLSDGTERAGNKLAKATWLGTNEKHLTWASAPEPLLLAMLARPDLGGSKGILVSTLFYMHDI